MLGSNIKQVGWPKSGEIDILEYIGKEPDMVFTTLHTQANHGDKASSHKTKFENIEEGFHTYGVDWTKEKMDFYVDGILVFTFNPKDKTEDVWPFNQPFYFILNVAVGGNFGGPEVDDSIFPQEFIIDYVRVYSNK
ncbi:Beta-glucanase precursor [compost metagenome]